MGAVQLPVTSAMNSFRPFLVSALAVLAAIHVAAVRAETGVEHPVIGLQTGQVGDLSYAVRPALHMTLPSTDATVPSLYNRLHRPDWAGAYSGVAKLDLFTTEGSLGCTAALLSTGRHLLTAAHCVTDLDGRSTLLGGVALFPTVGTNAETGSFEAVGFSRAIVHPGWGGTGLMSGNDLAIITLDTEAPAAARRYELYTGNQELGAVHTRVGWGEVGLGNGTTVFASGLRQGENVYESTGTLVEPLFNLPDNDKVLYYDFDDGLTSPALGYAPHDAFGYWFGRPDLGLGLSESMASPGDSGGPTFIDGRIAGIASFDLTFWAANLDSADATDPTRGPDSSFGEFGGDTRVSAYAGWITTTIPEPETYALMLAGLGLLAAAARRRSVRSR